MDIEQKKTTKNWGIEMNNKGISWMIIAIVIIAVVVVGGVAYWAMTNTGDGGGNGGDETPDIAGATSLKFDVSATIEGVQEDYSFLAKNLGASNVMIRVNQIDAQGMEFTYILNAAEEKVWIYYDGTWTDYSDTFSLYWDTWNPALDGYKDALADWTGTGNYEYNVGDNSFTISGISVNPTLDDSLFSPD